MASFLHRFQSDESLMLAYQRGDASAFETVYQRHKNAVFAFLLRSGAQQDSVEEIFQEAWTSIIRGISRYEPKAAFKTYLYQVAHNKLIDHWRRRKHEMADSETHLEQAAVLASQEQEVLSEQILRAIGALPVEQRCALLLKQQGFTPREICQITGANAEAVKSRLRYAQQTLRQTLAGKKQ